MKDKTIIITGCSGFIGRNLCKYLNDEYYIIGYDKENPHPKFSRYIDRFINRDITEELLNHNDIYAVIHLAARAGVRGSRENFESYVKDNVIGTYKIIEKCINQWKPKKILLASSSSIYGDRSGDMKETHIYNPKSPYAMSKVSMEQLVKSYKNNKLLDCEVCNMRIFTVYGPHQRDGLAIHNFIDSALKDKELTVYGDGNQKRDFTYINDLCKAISMLLRKEKLPFILNMGYGSKVSINEVLDIISKYLDKELKIIHEKKNRYDVYQTISNTRLFHRTLLNLKQDTKIKDGIIKQIEQMKGDII